MVTAMLLLQPFPVPCSSSTIPSVHILSSSHLLQPFGLLLSCFFLLLPIPMHQHSPDQSPTSFFLLIFLLCPSSRPLWLYFFSKQLFPVFAPFTAPVPCLSSWGKESRTPAQPDLLPSSLLCITAGAPPPASLQHPGQG